MVQDYDRQGREPDDRDIEVLSRYLDGELPPPESRELEARLAGDSALRSALVRLEELNHRLRDALSERATIPANVSTLLEDASEPTLPQESQRADNVLRFPGRRPGQPAQTPGRWPLALAASLVMAVGVGLVLTGGDDVGPGLPGNDRLVSAALDAQASGSGWAELGDGRAIQPILTFPHQDGRWCREYLLRDDADWRAVACRVGGRWVTQAAGLESYLDTGSAYRPAGSGDAAPVAVFINKNAADIALGFDAEQALLATWE